MERTAGVLGVLGALLMLGGDALLYAHVGDRTMADAGLQAALGVGATVLAATPTHLYLSVVIAPIATLLYLCGVWHVYRQLILHTRFWAAFVTVGFAAMFVAGGAYHALWSPYAFVLQSSAADPAASVELLTHTGRLMRLTYGVAALAGYPAAVVLLVLVVARKSSYPRFTAAVNPGILIGIAPLLRPAAERLSEPLGAMLMGGWINAVFAVFFAVSLASTGPVHRTRR